MSYVNQPIGKTINELLEVIGLIVEHIFYSLRNLAKGNVLQSEFWNHTYQASWKSTGTIVITTLSIGMVGSLQLTKHFAEFGALGEIGGANALAQIRELAPVIGAVVMTGRIGSAWAAEIGTMKTSEQISALKIMKITPEWFLVTPRVLACMIAMPIMNVVAILSSLTGAFIIASVIADVDPHSFIESVKRYIDVYDFFASTLKAIAFGGVIASIACSCGLQADGGAAGVGKYTTKAVVTSLICLFALNYVMSFLLFSLLK